MSEPFGTSGPFVLNEARHSPSTLSPFMPILILGLVLLVWFGFQALQLRAERDAMREVIVSQEKAVQGSKKLRDSLDAVARGTAQLADGGNANARLIVGELKKRGITISSNQPTGLDPNAMPAAAK